MRVIAAMSGGVDSSVAAAMLRRAGHDVLGVHLLLRPSAEGAGAARCVGPAHAQDARRAAEAAGIPFRTLALEDCFEREIVQPFLAAYQAGETPNPCVWCNARVKLGPPLEWAKAEGFEAIATGHYARVRFDEGAGRWQIWRGRNRDKDQSYYLMGLSQEQLAHLTLPLGEIEDKADTRRRAREWGLPVADKAESQDICLVGGADYREFLEARLGRGAAGTPGPIVNARGEPIGRHRGLARYTVGQRKGLGIAHARPLYVIELRPESNTLVVGEEEELRKGRLLAREVNWVSIAPPPGPLRAEAQIRYRHSPAPCIIHPRGAGEVEAIFDEPQRAIAPGQMAAFYRGEVLLGGGRIARE
ncbi:MAG: tRNA 2-thiouridine(34) synthase MnmA [Candidatus Sumerlaeota bacterium]|nr:tRNA 2-thiouridine(34) synthase MnmA [Candidatus Sumerlaeota bacterium]